MNKKTLAVMCSLAIATLCGAQGHGGPPPGGGGFRGGPGGPGGPNILMMQDVQKELNLTAQQKQAVEQLFQRGGRRGQGEFGPPQGGPGGEFGPPQGGPGGPGGEFGPPQGGPDAGPGGPGRMRPDDNEKKVKEILNGTQYARYQELTLQFRGPSAILSPETSEKLGVTEAQREKIRAALESMRPGPPPEMGAERPDPEQMFKEMEKKRADADKAILAVLTSEQRSKWETMLGKPFKFQRQQMRPPGGG
jgi:Spy/CpxP family protein refolding chaperone